MKKLKWFLLVGLISIILPFLLIIILAVATAGSPTGGSGIDGATYAEHWSSGDPYTHNLLVHRYGITAEVTPREHAAIYRFTFPESGEANIAMDVTHSLTRDIAKYIGGSVKANSVKIDPSSPDKFSGMIEYEGGFSE